jgi:hypothetical protein
MAIYATGSMECGDGARVLQVDRSGMCDAESDCVFCVFKPCARIPWFWGLNNNNLVKSLHFPQALTGLLPGSRAREQARKDRWTDHAHEPSPDGPFTNGNPT